MCGICGLSWDDHGLVKEMQKAIAHRGPDDQGSFTDESVSLGHLRLSIIDLSSAGHQPMFYDKRSGAFSERHNSEFLINPQLGLVFNGEIYNFQELRSELELKGYSFSTRTDSEVILAGYMEWGYDCVKRFNGMWAFAIYDKAKGVIFCSRDRLGKKPLYYYADKERFAFGSELKCLVRAGAPTQVDPAAIDIYLTTGFIPAPMTIYKGVNKLEARHSLVYDLKKKAVKKLEYYKIPKYRPVDDREKLVEEAQALLRESVKARLVADVPVGAFLSGGLDSSAVVATMSEFTDKSKLHTFSIGFDGKYDESDYIRAVKDELKTKHHHYYFKRRDFNSMLDKISYHYDEPFGDYSNFPTYEVARQARQHVTVVLSGDGGDEIFGGYTFHKIAARVEQLKAVPRAMRSMLFRVLPPSPPHTFIGSVKEALRASLASKEEFYALVGSDYVYKPAAFKDWSRKRMKEVLSTCNGDFREAMVRYDLFYNTLADNFMVKVDRATMAHALEARCPFMDYRFIELESKIPVEWKATPGKSKILMRDVISPILPRKIVNRGKSGFTPPLQDWIWDPKLLSEAEKGLVEMHSQGFLSDEWRDFYLQRSLKEQSFIYANYNIRLLLLYKWWLMWHPK